MSQFEIYTFVLCLTVFISLTALFITLLAYAIKPFIRLIRCGEEDETILKEYENGRKKTKKRNLFFNFVSALICLALCIAFAGSVYLYFTEGDFSSATSHIKVVKSTSMSYQNAKNTYLSQNNLKNQIQIFDLVVTHNLPDEFDLELYDIVIYEKDGEYVIHRIVGIEEPNEKHPDCRHFVLQGDAVKYPDEIPVYYSQMRAIYQNERIPFVGSFIMFLQSPAGYLCILLILFGIIATPVVEKKLEREKRKRLAMILGRKAAVSEAVASVGAGSQKSVSRTGSSGIKTVHITQKQFVSATNTPLGILLFGGICMLLGMKLAKRSKKSKVYYVIRKKRR